MRPETINAIMKALVDHPDGMTAKEIAPLLDCAPVTASQRMSELHGQGDLRRENVAPKWRSFEYRYSLPEVTAPPAADVESSSVASQPAGVE